MKKQSRFLLLMLSAILLMTSCVTSKDSLKNEQKTSFTEPPPDRNAYSVLNRVEAKASSFRIWVLFIPIGGISDRGLYDIAYKKAVEGTDGILLPHYTFKRVRIPLLIVTPVFKTVKVEGSSFRLKKDEEYRQENKTQTP